MHFSIIFLHECLIVMRYTKMSIIGFMEAINTVCVSYCLPRLTFLCCKPECWNAILHIDSSDKPSNLSFKLIMLKYQCFF